MKTFVPGQIASAADVNANFSELQAAVTPGSWVTLSDPSGWSKTNLQVRKMGNVVELRGTIQYDSSNIPSGVWNSMWTLPAGYRPSAAVSFAASCFYSATVNREAQSIVTIGTDGGVTFTVAKGNAYSVDVHHMWILG